jgi:tRNA threonylcarbamoyladenosine biosynthesis protein TsaB
VYNDTATFITIKKPNTIMRGKDISMKILSIDSSEKTVSVSLLENKKVLADFFLDSELKHSQTLAPMVNSVLKNLGFAIDKIDLFAANIGPGSFTGLRIGTSFINGIALAAQKGCIGISTLLAIAYNCLNFDGIIFSCICARENEFYFGVFKSEFEKIIRIKEDCIFSLSQILSKFEEYQSEIILVGNGIKICYDAASTKIKDRIRIIEEKSSRARNTGLAAFDVFSGTFEYLEPNYLKLSKAERELENAK